MSNVHRIKCWSCHAVVSLIERDVADGNCPHCSVELDLESYLVEAMAERDQILVERDGANERAGLLLKAKDEWAERARAAEEEAGQIRAAISRPETVFIGMKRGTIAKPSLRSMIDLYGEVVNGDEAQLLEIAQLSAEVEALRKDAPRWITIHEAQPEVGQYIVMAGPQGYDVPGRYWRVTGVRRSDGYYDGNGCSYPDITHWYPLLEVPGNIDAAMAAKEGA